MRGLHLGIQSKQAPLPAGQASASACSNVFTPLALRRDLRNLPHRPAFDASCRTPHGKWHVATLKRICRGLGQPLVCSTIPDMMRVPPVYGMLYSRTGSYWQHCGIHRSSDMPAAPIIRWLIKTREGHPLASKVRAVPLSKPNQEQDKEDFSGHSVLTYDLLPYLPEMAKLGVQHLHDFAHCLAFSGISHNRSKSLTRSAACTRNT